MSLDPQRVPCSLSLVLSLAWILDVRSCPWFSISTSCVALVYNERTKHIIWPWWEEPKCNKSNKFQPPLCFCCSLPWGLYPTLLLCVEIFLHQTHISMKRKPWFCHTFISLFNSHWMPTLFLRCSWCWREGCKQWGQTLASWCLCFGGQRPEKNNASLSELEKLHWHTAWA